MSKTLTFIDSGVLIYAARGFSSKSMAALAVLGDAAREFASSIFIELEVRPKALYNKRNAESAFYELYFKKVARWAAPDDKLFKQAYQLACDYGLSGFDALHVAAALGVHADEFVTTEKATKPLHRVRGVKVVVL